MTTNEAILVIFGLGKDQKPRAARFSLPDEEVALRAAHAMELGIGRAEAPEALSLAKGLPEGKPFATGKSLLPLARKDTYDKLIKLLVPFNPALLAKFREKVGPAPTPATSAAKQGIPDPWEGLAVGSIVLCKDPEPGPERSWWPCVVSELAKDVLTVRWQGYPTQKPFRVKRNAVALTRK